MDPSGSASPVPAPETDRFPDSYSLGQHEDEMTGVAILLGIIDPDESD